MTPLTGPGSERWTALCREAAIAGQSVSAGLAALSRANYATTGLYSHAFFSLSVGFERTLKLISVLDYQLDYAGASPTTGALKAFGHDISSLSKHVAAIAGKRLSGEELYAYDPSSIEDQIVDVLSEFAVASRYYNLNLISGAQQRSDDPVRVWYDQIGGLILQKHHTPKKQARELAEVNYINERAGHLFMVMDTSEDGRLMTDYKDAALQTARVKVLQKYGVWYVAKAFRYFYMILYRLTRRAQGAGLDTPYLEEFFFPFLNDDAMLMRKTFPPRGQ